MMPVMERPGRFEDWRFVGDKRTQLVYDLDAIDDDDDAAAVVNEFVAAGVGTCFSPDTLAEARNRGYAPAARWRHRPQRTPRS